MEIQEIFATFLVLERQTGKHIAQKILDFYEESGINPIQYRVQCYDDDPEKKGTASFILKESENVLVMHCCLHNLNLSNFGISKNSTY